jgi:hypothetical protein
MADEELLSRVSDFFAMDENHRINCINRGKRYNKICQCAFCKNVWEHQPGIFFCSTNADKICKEAIKQNRYIELFQGTISLGAFQDLLERQVNNVEVIKSLTTVYARTHFGENKEIGTCACLYQYLYH